MNKSKWLDIAEVLDAHRVIPKLFMFAYGYLLYDTTMWYRGIPDPTNAQSLALSAVWGAAAIITAWYLNTGRKWQ